MKTSAMATAALLGAAVLAGVVACDAVTDPGERERLAFITGYHDDDPHILVPARVAAGVPFTVRVRTYGPSGCWRQGDTDALRFGATVRVFPFDRLTDADACTAVVQAFEHTAEITFDQPGDAVVVVRGREGGSDDVVTFEFPVVVEEVMILHGAGAGG